LAHKSHPIKLSYKDVVEKITLTLTVSVDVLLNSFYSYKKTIPATFRVGFCNQANIIIHICRIQGIFFYLTLRTFLSYCNLPTIC